MSRSNLDALNFNNESEYKTNIKQLNYKTYTYPVNMSLQSDGVSNKNFTFDEVPFLAFQEHKKKYSAIATEAYKSFGTDSELSEVFFSQQNITRVQKGLTYYIKKRTGNKVLIDDQPFEDIIVRMQNTFYTYGRFLQNDIDKQVQELNMITIKEMIPEVITQIKQQMGYLRDISRPPPMMDQPTNVSSKGKRTLPSTSGITFSEKYPDFKPIIG
jgi:hypothetical protein